MVKVLIVAEIRLYRQGLSEILGKGHGLRITDTAGSYEEAVACVKSDRPDVVLFDMTMPEGLSAINAIGQMDPGITVVAFAVRELEKEVLACVEAGAAAWVPPEAPLGVLVDTVLKAVRGELVCSPYLAGSLARRVGELSSTLAPGPETAELTPRQLDVAELIEQGCSNREIARELCIEMSTVKVHVSNVLEKMRVRRRGQVGASLRPYIVRRRGGLSRKV